MGDLTRNFSRREFQCRNGEQWPSADEDALKRLVDACQKIRDAWGEPIAVVSAYRSLDYNRGVGSKDTSQHCGRNPAKSGPPCAVDLACENPSHNTTSGLHQLIREMIRTGEIPNGGVGFYPRSGFVHYDDRAAYGHKPARWRQKA